MSSRTVAALRTIVLVLAVSLAFLLPGCGGGQPGADGTSGGSKPAPVAAQPDPVRLYTVNTMVLEDASHGPMLCLGGVATSHPPLCGDVPIANWSWHGVEGEEAALGTTWGSYHVVGRYDGQVFTASDVGPYEDDPVPRPEPDFASPCRAPAGGWTGVENATQGDVQPADAYAQSQPDYVTSWITQLDPPALQVGPVIFNSVFTVDAERHKAKIRKVWSGPLCVVAWGVPTARELGRIREVAEASLGDLGFRMLSSQTDSASLEPVIEIAVVVDVDGKGQAAVDARFGAGVVRLISALKPVP